MKKNMRSKQLKCTVWMSILCISFFIVVFSFQSAHAVTTLRLSDGTTIVDVTDGDSDDTRLEAGIVGYDGMLGVFDLNLTAVGILAGTLTHPEMSFSSLVINSGTGSLDIWLSETGFGQSTGVFETTVSGTTKGTVMFNAYRGSSMFDDAYEIASIGSISGSDTSGAFANLNDYSLTLKTSITHESGGDSTSISSLQVKVVPEPVSAILFITGGAALGLKRFRKKFKK